MVQPIVRSTCVRVLTTGHGVVAAPVALACLVLSSLGHPTPARPCTDRCTAAVASIFARHQHRVRCLSQPELPHQDRAAHEQRRYFYRQCGQSVLIVAVLGLIGIGLVLAVVLSIGLVRGRVDGWELVTNTALGLLLLFLALQGLLALLRADASRADDFFGLSERERLHQQIVDLNRARSAVLNAVDAERRRIERDLHDGLQQRLVAAGLMLAEAARNSDQVGGLTAQAAEQIAMARQELRDVSWAIYPASLHQVGLGESLLTLAQHSTIPMTVHYQVSELPPALEVALYFTTAELVTNANKHSRASAITVDVEELTGQLRLSVSDDGIGGASDDGTGLAGVRSRVESIGGTFTVTSPAGGPTTAEAEIPCG